MAPRDEQLYETVQTISNNVLELVKTTGNLSERIAVVGSSVDWLKVKQEEMDSKYRQIVNLLSTKMSPERCGYMHGELEQRVRKWTKDYIKEGARGWGRTAVFVLKVLVYMALIFGSGAWGAQSLGLLKALGS